MLSDMLSGKLNDMLSNFQEKFREWIKVFLLISQIFISDEHQMRLSDVRVNLFQTGMTETPTVAGKHFFLAIMKLSLQNC